MVVKWQHLPAVLLAQSEPEPTVLEQLSPLNQLRVIVGLFVVLVLGLVLFLVIKAGAHMMKGYSAAANRLSQSSLPDEIDWTSRPLDESETPDDE